MTQGAWHLVSPVAPGIAWRGNNAVFSGAQMLTLIVVILQASNVPFPVNPAFAFLPQRTRRYHRGHRRGCSLPERIVVVTFSYPSGCDTLNRQPGAGQLLTPQDAQNKADWVFKSLGSVTVPPRQPILFHQK